MAAAELAGPREKDERGSHSWEFEENTSSLYRVNENKAMAPVWRDSVSLRSTGPDSGDRRVGKCAHSAPGRDATLSNVETDFNSPGSVETSLYIL